MKRVTRDDRITAMVSDASHNSSHPLDIIDRAREHPEHSIDNAILPPCIQHTLILRALGAADRLGDLLQLAAKTRLAEAARDRGTLSIERSVQRIHLGTSLSTAKHMSSAPPHHSIASIMGR
jgi:hypothetical protein